MKQSVNYTIQNFILSDGIESSIILKNTLFGEEPVYVIIKTDDIVFFYDINEYYYSSSDIYYELIGECMMNTVDNIIDKLTIVDRLSVNYSIMLSYISISIQLSKHHNSTAFKGYTNKDMIYPVYGPSKYIKEYQDGYYNEIDIAAMYNREFLRGGF